MLQLINPTSRLCTRALPLLRALSTQARNWTVVEKVSDRQVPPLSNVTINAVDCPVVVVPADPQQYPDSDRLLIYLLKDQEDDKTKLQLIQATPNTFNIDVQGESKEEKTLEIHVPVQTNLSAFCNGSGGFAVKDLHSDRLIAVTSTGQIETKNIRCSEIVLATQGGSVFSKGVLQGKINIKSLGKGSVECQRLQGPLAMIESERGNISIASDYCDKSSVNTNSGTIKFGSLHRKCKVEITGRGNLIAAGLDGRLQAVVNEGSVELQVSNLQGNSSLEVAKGNVKVQIGDCDNYAVTLSADKVEIPEDVNAERKSVENKDSVVIEHGDCSEGKLSVNVGAGSICFEKSSWIASLNLGKGVGK